MKEGNTDHPSIFIAFRFHANFYHSYRGDTPDELGFGKDIRIIRHIIKTLDQYNQKGVDVCGTWDFENYFSLETIMPEHCPDIIESLRRRITDGKDEIQLMSYNNGMISTHTAKEFEEAVSRAITNKTGSGIRDLFGQFSPMVRPQEMMYTPIHLMLYPQYGIQSISLFYSALPFNTFSNFVPPLTFKERHNPLTLTYPGIDETMTLIPAFNTGDLVDNISLRKWVKRMRRKQLLMDTPKDLLLLLDMDADDDFWVGFDVPILKKFYSTLNGLQGLIESILDLDFVSFTTPCRYLENHKSVGSVAIHQDTADGSFDGLSSWAEKRSNQHLWTGIERSRVLEMQTLCLLEKSMPDDIHDKVKNLLSQSFEERLKTFSSTHFGLSSPIMNKSRLEIAKKRVASSVSNAKMAFNMAKKTIPDKNEKESLTLINYLRGVSTQAIEYQAKSSKGLVTLPLKSVKPDITSVILCDETGKGINTALRVAGNKVSELLFVEHMKPYQKKHYSITYGKPSDHNRNIDNAVSVTDSTIQNEFFSLRFDTANHLTSLSFQGKEMAQEQFLNSAVTYSGKRYDVGNWILTESQTLGHGLLGIKKMQAEILLKTNGIKKVTLERKFIIVSGLPYLYIYMNISYPETSMQKYKKERAVRLEQKWDGNWHEVLPCEITPSLSGKKGNHLRIWKHNYLNHMSFFDLNYGEFSKNKELDSFNNQITNGWVAVTDGEKGLLVAQTAESLCSLAFCPMRTRKHNDETRIFLNPFGSYYGKQLKYGTAFTGLGRAAALMTSDHLDPYAPSYNGKKQKFSLMIAPYMGDAPPEEIRNDAEAFSYPYIVLAESPHIAEPGHRRWEPA